MTNIVGIIPVIFNEEQYNISRLYKLWETIAEYLDEKNEINGLYDEMQKFDDDDDYERRCFELLERALKSLGITSPPAVEVFNVLLAAHKAGLSVSAREVREKIIGDRRRRGNASKKGLTLRNIQVWLGYYTEIGVLDNNADKYMFKAAKKPSKCFKEYTKPVIDASVDYTRRALEKMEEAHSIK